MITNLNAVERNLAVLGDGRVSVAVSTVIFALRPTKPDGSLEPWLPLVIREREPYKGLLALPGGPVRLNESLTDSALNTLRITTNISPAYLEQLHAFGSLFRSLGPLDLAHGVVANQSENQPSKLASYERVITIVYWAALPQDDAANTSIDGVTWVPAKRVPKLSFDHNEIVEHAMARLCDRVLYSPVAHSFLPETFTLSELREVHEAILDRRLDPANFRRRVLSLGVLVDVGSRRIGINHRPPRLYRFTSKPFSEQK